jgi:hypothetical protein
MEEEKKDQTQEQEKVTNPLVEDEKSQAQGTDAEKISENKQQDTEPAKKEENQFASETELKKDEVDYKEKFSASQSEAIRLKKENEELKSRLSSLEDNINNKDINKPSFSSAYDMYIRKQVNSEIGKTEKELSNKYPELQKPEFKKQVGTYTKRFIGVDKDLGIYFNRVTREPITPDEYKQFVIVGITIAQRDVLTRNAKEEGRKEAYSAKTTNEFATQSKDGGEQRGSEDLNAPREIVEAFKKMGVKPDEMKSYIAEWKKKQG